MNSHEELTKTRRKFLRMLAASPVLAGPSIVGGSLLNLMAGGEVSEGQFRGWLETLQQNDAVITSPEEALDVFDFEAAARKAIPPAHFGYLATGVDDDATVKLNHDGYSHIQIRARRFVNAENVDMSRTIFGTKWETPLVLSPVSAQKAFHPEGEVAVARAARVKNHLMMLSTVATASIEEAIAARGGPVWQQLYATNIWEVARAIVKRAEAAGSPAIVLTVDIQDGSNRETLYRAQRVDTRDCTMCHTGGYTPFGKRKQGMATGTFADYVARKPMFKGLDVSKVKGLHPEDISWDFLKKLRDTVSVKLLVKGIVTREDAQLAVEHGVDGLVVSNHGGRSEETLRPTIESLPEVLEGVGGKVPVIIDGGIRRGTDIFKAMALGATAVGIGRPHSWGLGAFGQAGVEAVLEILRREFRAIMRQAGTTSVNKITQSYLVTKPS
jgi:4-hydroxymandelate oxidase